MCNQVPTQPLRFLACSPWFSPLLLSLLPVLIIPDLWPLGSSFFRDFTPQCPWVAPLADSDITSLISIERSLFPIPPHSTIYTLAPPLPIRCYRSSCLDFAEFLRFKSVSLLLPFCLLSLSKGKASTCCFFHSFPSTRISAFRYQMTSSVAERKSRAKNPDGKYPSRTSNRHTNEG